MFALSACDKQKFSRMIEMISWVIVWKLIRFICNNDVSKMEKPRAYTCRWKLWPGLEACVITGVLRIFSNESIALYRNRAELLRPKTDWYFIYRFLYALSTVYSRMLFLWQQWHLETKVWIRFAHRLYRFLLIRIQTNRMVQVDNHFAMFIDCQFYLLISNRIDLFCHIGDNR